MLRVSLLGEQAIVDDRHGRVRGRSSRVVVLIAFLVLHAGSAQTRPRIAGLLWPESTDAQALTNLRRELHHLRQLLGDDPSLVVTSRELCWRDAKTVSVDVRVFDAARRAALAAAAEDDDPGLIRHTTAALAAYRGELLPGGYDDWLLDARAQLERQCAELCDLACDALARAGDLARAVEVARRRVRLQPFEEVGYRTLMELQADMGDRAGAVSTYHHCESVLERELGVPPDPATRQVFEHLMARARAATDTEAGPAAGPRRPPRSLSAGPPRSACCGSRGRPPPRAAAGSCWSAAARVSGRPASSPTSRSWPGCRARWSRLHNASGRPGGSLSRRWRTGFVMTRSKPRQPTWIPPGAPR